VSVQIKELQQIPEGYRQTEVGVIPDDWGLQSIDAFAEVSSGGTPNRKNKGYWNGDIPWVTTTLINGHEIQAAEQFITEKGLTGSATKWFKKGTILMAMYGQGKTRGKVSVLGIDATINQACAAIVVKKTVEVDFFLHYLNGKYDEIRNLSNAGGQENLSGSIIKTIMVPVPLKNEQIEIANALTDVDTLISALEKLISKKQDIKTAAMQQLLTGKKRLPPFDQAVDGKERGYKQSELGKIPVDWSAGLFGDYLEFCASGATPYRGRPEFYKGNFRWVSSGELNYNVIYDTIEKVSEDAIKKTNLRIHPAGTFLMAITGLEAAGTRGSCGILGAPSATNQSCMALYPNHKLSTNFLFHYYVYKGNELAFKYCQGTKQQSYTAKLVKLLPINVPDTIEEQEAIACALSDIDSDIKALEQRLIKTKLLKKGMMQELLTGRTRLL